MKIIIVLIVIAIIMTLPLGYFGFFRDIQVKLQNHEKMLIVYKPVTGSYKQSGIISDDVYQDLLDTYGIETYKGIGIYYDDPQKVEESKLRSRIGCVIEQKDYTKIEAVKTKYEVMEIDKKNYPTVEIPYKGKFSVIIGLIKVYPKLNKYIEQNMKSFDSIIEIWDIPNRKIIYLISS